MGRYAEVERKTKETAVRLAVSLDGEGHAEVSTGIPFLDHMLSLMAMQAMFDLNIQATGDLSVDYHHTVEDVGITLGQALRKALGDLKGIRRFGDATVPMDEALSTVVVDVSGRPILVYRVDAAGRILDFDAGLAESFLKALVDHAGITMHVNLWYGKDLHHILESVFKGLGRALDQATDVDLRRSGVPSTKGTL